jgi:2-polyprenyl-3-methyl-5-hydroxy-6-metoxy-1,4-benzoquinol methylase
MLPPTQTLIEEAEAFNHQIEQRVANGHIPDLRRCEPCDWFYNNPWRRPAYVELDFGEQFTIIHDAILQHLPVSRGPVRVLEVGCGPGYLSLELARAGFDVTGLDISPKSVQVAERFAFEDPYASTRGPLRYLRADFLNSAQLKPKSFNAVVFLGSLHHFPNQAATLHRVRELLAPNGLIVAHEPVRDRVTHSNALLGHLLRVLLSLQGGFFKNYPVPENPLSAELDVSQLFSEMRYETNDGTNVQSVNDNEAGYAEMHPALEAVFEQLQFSWRYAFFHEIIGGLRFDECLNVKLARYLREVDRELCRAGVLSATEFFFVGRLRS